MLVTVLLGLLMFFLGWGSNYLLIGKRINGIGENCAAQSRDIKTLYGERDRLNKKTDTAILLHTEALGLMKEVINQNNLLIQKITVDKG